MKCLVLAAGYATRLYAMEMPGKRYDIGTLDSYKKICEKYEGVVK